MKAQFSANVVQISQCLNGCCDILTHPYQTNYKVYDFKNKIRRNKAGMFFYDKRDNKILLVQSRGEKWGPPKGSMEGVETMEECAIREVMEETGLDISLHMLEGCERIRIDRSMYYYLEVNREQLSRKDNTLVADNDASGVMWIDVGCLETMVKTGFIDLNSHCKKLLHKLFKIKFL